MSVLDLRLLPSASSDWMQWYLIKDKCHISIWFHYDPTVLKRKPFTAKNMFPRILCKNLFERFCRHCVSCVGRYLFWWSLPKVCHFSWETEGGMMKKCLSRITQPAKVSEQPPIRLCYNCKYLAWYCMVLYVFVRYCIIFHCTVWYCIVLVGVWAVALEYIQSI